MRILMLPVVFALLAGCATTGPKIRTHTDPAVDFVDLGVDHYDRRGGTQRAIRNHVSRLHALGYTVTLTPVALA